MPLIPLLIIVTNLKSIFRKFLEIKARLVFAVLLILLFTAIVGVILFFVMRNPTGRASAPTLAAWFYLLLFIAFLVSQRNWFVDRLRWMKRSKSYSRPITGSGFLDELALYSTSKMRLRVIQLIKKTGSLIACEETENTIARLCLKIGREQQQRKRRAAEAASKNLLGLFERSKKPQEAPINQDDDFDIWYKCWVRKPTSLIWHEYDILDELSYLLEQVRGKRQTRGS